MLQLLRTREWNEIKWGNVVGRSDDGALALTLRKHASNDAPAIWWLYYITAWSALTTAAPARSSLSRLICCVLWAATCARFNATRGPSCVSHRTCRCNEPL